MLAQTTVCLLHDISPLAATSPARAPSQPAQPTQPPSHDLSYLLTPSNYHSIPSFLIPSAPPPPSSTPSSLFAKQQYQSAALAAAHRLTQPPSPPATEIFSLLFTRLVSLTKCALIPLAIAEATLFGDINAPFYRVDPQDPQSNILPWELRVLVFSLLSLQGRELRQGSAAAPFYDMAAEARARCKRAGPTEEEKKLWKARVKELGWMAVNALVQEGDPNGAIRLMKELRAASMGPDWVSRMILLYLKVGDVEGAKRVLENGGDEVGERELDLEALIYVSEGDYGRAARTLQARKERNHARNNVAVMHFYLGSIERALQLLDEAVNAGDTSKGAIFNLATCYELLVERSANERKEELLQRVRQQVGAGGSALGQVDFKL